MISWNVLIVGYVQHKLFNNGAKLPDCMQQTQGIPPTSITFSCILKACATLGAVDMGKELHKAINKMGLLPKNQFASNVVATMFSE